MIRRKKDTPKRPSNNPAGNYKSLAQYHVEDIYDEVAQNLNCENYDEVMAYFLAQPFSKVKFCVDKAKDLPMIVKCVCSALLKDMQYGRISGLQMVLERIKGKPAQQIDLGIENNNQPLKIEVFGAEVEPNKIDLLKNESK